MAAKVMLLLSLVLALGACGTSAQALGKTKNMAYLSPLANLPHHVAEPANVPDHSFQAHQDPDIVDAAGRRKLSGVTRVGSFLHGIASGDPATDAVIIWTKITPANTSALITVNWMMGRARIGSLQVTNDFNGSVVTSADVDFTVKLDVTGLSPNTRYYYKFFVEGASTAVAATRTLPSASDRNSATFAVVSCSNLPAGYFNVYKEIANRADVMAVLHVGDYIYEYKDGSYTNSSKFDSSRKPQPDKEITTLQDYRMRHAQYKLDPDLQLAHRNKVWMTIWDDHEFTNNAWKKGAENHQPGEGEWAARVFAAARAYYEYLPVRQAFADSNLKIYRTFRWGTLADIIMIEDRVAGRMQQIDDDNFAAGVCPACNASAASAVLNDPERQFLGAEQEAWLYGQLAVSKSRNAIWRLIGNQVTFSEARFAGRAANAFFPGSPQLPPFPPSYDAWSGYPAAKNRILNFLKTTQIPNVVFATGDIHTSWAYDVVMNPFISTTVANYPNWPVAPNPAAKYDASTGAGSLAVEFVGPSVTSPGLEGILGDVAYQITGLFEAGLKGDTPQLKFVDLTKKGYMTVKLTTKAAFAQWCYVSTVYSKNYTVSCNDGFHTLVNTNRLVKGAPPS